MLVSRKIPHLLGGVSQNPADLRSEYHVADLENGILHPALGVVRRPPTSHVATVPLAGTGPVLLHEFVRQDDRYLVVACNGDLKVFRASDGTEMPVSFPQGKAYLSGGSLVATSAGDMVVVANRSAVMAQDSSRLEPALVNEAVVWVVSGNQGTTYSVIINRGVTVSYTTMVGTTSVEALSAESNVIASNLCSRLDADSQLSDFVFTPYLNGSAFHVARSDGQPFEIATEDGHGNAAITVVRDSVTSLSDLPKRARPGMVVRVLGDRTTGVDDYFVRFDGEYEGEGAWVECAQPGSRIAFDASTMPWGLYPGGNAQPLGAHAVSPQPTVQPHWNASATPAHYDYVVITIPEVPYPVGASIIVTGTGSPVSYTIQAGDTADDIAAGLYAALPGFGYGKLVLDNTVTIIEPAGNTSDITVLAFISLPTGSFYRPGLNLVDDEYVGYVLRNLTSGAAGTITSNTGQVIDTGGMSGGSRSTFLAGDVCEVMVATEGTFVCKPIAWREKAAGDSITVPFPSFLGRTVDEVFYYQGRLGLTAGDSIALSAAGDVSRWFRRTATALLPDDPIDVRQASREAGTYHSATVWRNGLYLFTSTGAHALTGEPVLTPSSVRIDPSSRLTSASVRPVVVGDTLFVTRDAAGYARVSEILPAPNTDERPTVNDVSDVIPSFIEGAPTLLVGDGSSGMVFLGSADQPTNLYVYSFVRGQDGRSIGAWGRWVFPGATILAATVSDGQLSLLTLRGATLTLERIDVGEAVSSTGIDYRDRQGLVGSEVAYSTSVVLHPLYRRTAEGSADTSGRLTLRTVRVFHPIESVFTVTVAQPARADAVTDSEPARVTAVPVYGSTEDVTITIRSGGAYPLRVTALEWVGTYTNWSRGA